MGHVWIRLFAELVRYCARYQTHVIGGLFAQASINYLWQSRGNEQIAQ